MPVSIGTTENTFANPIGLLSDCHRRIERFLQALLKVTTEVKGGSLENVIVLDKERVMNPEGLRFPDEFCRHKILDLIGDLALIGHPLRGRVVAERAGHAMHTALVLKLMRDRSLWELTTSGEFPLVHHPPIDDSQVAVEQAATG